MDSVFRRSMEMLIRVRVFGAEHAGLFPAGTKGADLFAALTPAIEALQELAGSQASGFASVSERSTSKSLARATLTKSLEAISVTAKSLAVTTPALADRFRLPKRVSEQKLVATARAFLKDATPLKDQFIAFEMRPNFLDDLETHIEQFEASISEKDLARGSRVAATAGMLTAMQRALDIVDQLRGVLHNRLEGDDALRTEWLAASHIERPRKGSGTKRSPTVSGDSPDKTDDKPVDSAP